MIQNALIFTGFHV